MLSTFWYTFATEVKAYSNPQTRFIVGIVKQDTAKKLQKDDEVFYLLPKDVDRHKKAIFKSSIHHLYQESKELVRIVGRDAGYITRKHKIQFFGKIIEEFKIDYSDPRNKLFISLISPLCPWTNEHVKKYLVGADSEIPKNIGMASVVILRIFKIPLIFDLEYIQATRDSSQVKRIEVDNINHDISFKHPVFDDDEFNELVNLVKFLFEKTR